MLLLHITNLGDSFFGDLISVDPESGAPRNYALHERELVPLISRASVDLPATTGGHQKSSATQSVISESPEAATAAPVVQTEVSRIAVEESSGPGGGLTVSNNTGRNGMSMFQGYRFCIELKYMYQMGILSAGYFYLVR